MASQLAHFAVFGDPVAHSLSPQLFHWLFAELGIAGHYEPVHVPPAELGRAVERVRSGDLDGASVTVPHKEKICALVDELDETSTRIGACNCIARTAGERVRGHNTDVDGLRLAFAHHAVSLVDARVLVLGAGGAGRAAAFALAAVAQAVFLANRTLERAGRLASDLISARPSALALPPAARREGASADGRCSVTALPLAAEALRPVLDEVTIVVNATRVGLSDPSADPLPKDCHLTSRHRVLDMVYQPLQTALLMRAARAGAVAIDGLWMLLYQAFEQLRLWTGQGVQSDLADRAHAYLCRIAQ